MTDLSPRPARRRPPVRAAWIAAVLLCAGCGGGPARVAVTGEVNLDGYPLPTGTITFTPAGSGAAASAEIVEGKFAITKADGPSPGECKVEVLSFRKTGRKIPGIGADGSGMTEEMKQVVPARYNTSTELRHTFAAGDNPPCQFKLTSR